MTEDDARAWITERFGVARAELLAHFLALVVAENGRQNLIAPSTIAQIWDRHALDSAQLVPLAERDGSWVDVGTGGGFPGLVVAILRGGPTILVEPRRRRAEFLAEAIQELGLDDVEVAAVKVENVRARAGIVSARAVTTVEKLLLAAGHCATTSTRWLLPRGRLGTGELAELRQRWSGTFHVEQSLTDPASSILVLDSVSPR